MILYVYPGAARAKKWQESYYIFIIFTLLRPALISETTPIPMTHMIILNHTYMGLLLGLKFTFQSVCNFYIYFKK